MKKSIKNLTISAVFLAVGLVLPFFTGQIPAIGNMLLPMHIPVFLCGLICGWQYGAAVGYILPLFRSLLFSAPPIYPNACTMALELMTYGLIAGLLYSRSKWRCVLSLYRSLLIAMICGRVVWGIAQMILLGFGGKSFTFHMFLAGAFLNAIPGIVLQLIFVPAVMIALNKTGLVPFKTAAKERRQ